MKQKGVIFLDYNETIEDISSSKGRIFSAALRRFIRHFDGEVEIVLITKADPKTTSIKDEFKVTLSFIPKDLRKYFSFIVEGSCKYISQINHTGDYPTFAEQEILSIHEGSKKDGVELTLKRIDPQNKVSVCVFAGDHEEIDLVMMDADVGSRDKFFILANRRILKSAKHPVYKLNMQLAKNNINISSDIEKTIGQTKNIIIKSKNQSYGVGKGLEAVTNLLHK